MAPPSVYRYFRSISIPLYFSGQFPVINVLSSSADRLQFKIFSIPLISFCLLECIVVSCVLITVLVRGNPLYHEALVMTHLVFKYLTLQWTKLKTKAIIQSLQALDELRQSSSLKSYEITAHNTHCFLWIAFGIFLSIHLILILFVNIFLAQKDTMVTFIFFNTTLYYFDKSHYRMMVLVSLLVYFCSLSVDYLRSAWDVHTSKCLHTRKKLREFCSLMEKEITSIRKIKSLLGGHFLVITVELVERLVAGICIDAVDDNVMLLNIFNLFESLLMFWCMISSISLPSSKFKEWSYDIFTTDLNKEDLTRRDAARIKTILVQIEDNPGEVNTAGYGSIDRNVFMWYLCLSIECLIFLWQNKDGIKEFVMMMK